MKGIEKITAHIEADAKAEAQEIWPLPTPRSGNRGGLQPESAGRVLDPRPLRCERVRGPGAAHESSCGHGIQKSILATKQELVARAFDRAQEMIINLPAEKYTEFLARLASESATTGEEEVIFNERDRNGCGAAVIEAANRRLLGKDVKAGLRMSAETRGICGGLILRQGGIEVNCTVETLIDLCRGEMSSQLAEVMFQ